MLVVDLEMNLDFLHVTVSIHRSRHEMDEPGCIGSKCYDVRRSHLILCRPCHIFAEIDQSSMMGSASGAVDVEVLLMNKSRFDEGKDVFFFVGLTPRFKYPYSVPMKLC